MFETYIPKDLDDCFEELNEILLDDDYLSFKRGTEEDVLSLHCSLGRHLRNKWGLWGDSRLAEWFKERKVIHPDDMSFIVLILYYRYINSQIVDFEKYLKEEYFGE